MNRRVTEKEKFRHELKYIVPEIELRAIERRIDRVLQPDAHAGQHQQKAQQPLDSPRSHFCIFLLRY